MGLKYTDQAEHAVQYAARTAKNRGHVYIGTEHLLLGLLKTVDGTAGMVLSEQGVEEEQLITLIDRLISPPASNAIMDRPGYTPRTRRVLERAEQEAMHYHADEIGTEHILIAMLKETDCVATRLLYTLGINIQKLFAALLIAIGEDQNITKEELQNQGGAENASNTPVLDQYSRDLTALARDGLLDPVVGRESEIRRVIEILNRRSKNNPCLVGEPGVGKTAIVEGLARRIAEGLVPERMASKRIVALDLSGMVAGSKYRGEFEERIKNVVREASQDKNILLFVDELHTLIGAGGAEGALDASNILKPSLSRGEIQMIGATTLTEYRKYIEKDAALERRFQPVTVDEPTSDEALEILKGLRPCYEEHHRVQISDDALKAAVAMSVRYINDRFLPDKAIDLVDESASRVQLDGYRPPVSFVKNEEEILRIRQAKEEAIVNGDFELAKSMQLKQEELERKTERARLRAQKKEAESLLCVTEDDIARTVAGWTKIPVEKIAEGESRRLARLEKILHKRVIGQDEAVNAVSKAIKRGRVGLKDPRRPVGSFLFLGPTGVGKTELSKALSEAVFGSEKAMIRVDMSEYMEKHSVSKLIGSPPGYVGYDEGGQLSEKVRRNPYSVLLFDEIEKAHPDVFNILLQVLDEGHITDAQGRKVDFKETCIIMTSNAGAQSIVEPKHLGFHSGEDAERDYKHMKGQVMDEVKRLFKPEFLNRIDDIIVFHSLTKDEIRSIMDLQIKELQQRASERLGITLRVSPRVKEHLIETSFDAKYGARPLKRAISNQLENALAEEILAGRIKRESNVSVGLARGEIIFQMK